MADMRDDQVDAMDMVDEFDDDELEARSEAALVADEMLPSTGLLSFYDRLRKRITDRVERKGGKLGTKTVRALLLVPDVFILLVRLSLDRDVPGGTRALIGGALAYFVLPVDLVPELAFGAAGFVDDLVLALAVLSNAFDKDLEPYARKHWSGSEDLRVVIKDVIDGAQGLLGVNVYDRLKNLLSRRGVRLE